MLQLKFKRYFLEDYLQLLYFIVILLIKGGVLVKTYLITGGAGFIGSTLTEKLLTKGNKVVVIDNFNNYYDPKLKQENIESFLDNHNYTLYRSDIRDRNEVAKVFDNHKFDVVVHLAAMAGVRPSIEDPILYQEVNGLGTQNILEEARLHNVQNLVLASSSSVYGNCIEVPFRENMIVDFAISPYAATKKANEVMAHVYHTLNKMNIIMLRFFTVYGPKQRPDLAINKFVRLMLDNKPIPMYGNGTTSRDYTYVDDIVNGIYQSCDYVMEHENVYEIINLGSNHPISLKDMIEIIGKELKIKPKIEQLPMQQGDVDRTYADISKAEKLLGYKPQVPFEDGIKAFIAWYLKNREEEK